MRLPDVSVLMAVFNGMPFLPMALASISVQAGINTEVILIDDASTDGSPEFMEAWAAYQPFPHWIIRHGRNVGLTRSLAEGLSVCHGRYVARQDADDVSLPGRLAMQARYLESHRGIAVVGSSYQIINERGELVRHGCQARWFPKAQMLLGRNPLAHGSAMFRREWALAAGGYRETFKRAQDLDLWLRMSQFGTVKILPQELYALREHPGRVSQTDRGEQAAYAQLARWAQWTGRRP